MLKLPLGVAMKLWGQTILLETSCQVLQPLILNTMMKPEHSCTHWLALVEEGSVCLLALVLFVTAYYRNC